MGPRNFPLRWESTGDQWWFASPIDLAVANGHYDLVKQLLNLDPNLLIKLTSLRRIRRLETLWNDNDNNGKLFNGVAKCRCQVAKKLLNETETNKKEQSPLFRAGHGGWLLYTAASAGDLEFVKELLNREPMLVFGGGEYGVTDIFYAAARSRNSEVLRLLLVHCSSVLPNRDSGEFEFDFNKEMVNRAVHAAARGGNVEVLRELIGDSEEVLGYRDDRGSTLLHSASGKGQVEVVKSLLKSYNISNCRDKQGNTALHVAAYKGHLAVIKVLLSASPSSISLTNDYGDTFLHMAVAGFGVPSFQRLDRQIELMKQLVSGEFVNIDDIINVRNNDGKTALHLAVMENIHTDLVEILMKAHLIGLNICDAEGNTPLDLLKQQHPRSASTEILIKITVSAGGISNNALATGNGTVSCTKPERISIGSPGTSFRNIGVENVSDDAHSGDMGIDYSSCLGALTPCHSVTHSNSSSYSKKLPSVNNAARRLKVLLQRAWIKNGVGKIGDNESVESYTQRLRLAEKPIPLRQRFPTTPSVSPKKKFSPGVRRSVLLATPPLSSVGSPSSPFSGSSWASTSQGKSGELGGSVSLKLFHNGGEESKMKRKYNSFNVRLVNKYFCFGAQAIAAMEHHPSSSSCEPRDQFYKHAVIA